MYKTFSLLTISNGIKEKFLIMLTALLFIFLVRFISYIVIRKKGDNPTFSYHFRKIFNIISVFIYLLFLIVLWNSEIKDLDIFLGMLSAGLAIVFKDVIINFAGWIFILIRKPLAVGDRIEISGIKGDVIDINIFKIMLIEVGNWVEDEQSTGRVVAIPNSKIFTEVLMNSSNGFDYIWNETPIYVTLESNFEKAKSILQNIGNELSSKESTSAIDNLRKVSKKMLVHYSKLTPIVYTKISENGMKLTLRYLCKPRKRRDTTQYIHERVLKEFMAEKDIVFSYRTSRVINYSYEVNVDQESR